MRIGAFFKIDSDDNYLKFLRQYGVHDLIFGSKAGGRTAVKFPHEKGSELGSHWKTEELIAVKKRVETFGFRLACIENPVPPWCWDKIQLGKPGRDVQIENLAMTIKAMGEAGIPIMGYNWMVNPHGVSRMSLRNIFNVKLRGDAIGESIDMQLEDDDLNYRDRQYTEEEMWKYYEYFVKAIVPVLEENNVKMALHPDDPPVEKLGGIPRLFGTVDSFRKAMSMANSKNSGLNFCLGNWTAMGTDIISAIHEFGSQQLIYYGHAQGVSGTVPKFTECFLDEADCDFFSVIREMNKVTDQGFLIPAHFPHTAGDTPEQHHGHAFGIGYLAGLNKLVNTL